MGNICAGPPEQRDKLVEELTRLRARLLEMRSVLSDEAKIAAEVNRVFNNSSTVHKKVLFNQLETIISYLELPGDFKLEDVDPIDDQLSFHYYRVYLRMSLKQMVQYVEQRVSILEYKIKQIDASRSSDDHFSMDYFENKSASVQKNHNPSLGKSSSLQTLPSYQTSMEKRDVNFDTYNDPELISDEPHFYSLDTVSSHRRKMVTNLSKFKPPPKKRFVVNSSGHKLYEIIDNDDRLSQTFSGGSANRRVSKGEAEIDQDHANTVFSFQGNESLMVVEEDMSVRTF